MSEWPCKWGIEFHCVCVYVYGCGCMRVWLGGHSNDKYFCILSAHLDTVARAGGYHQLTASVIR